MLRVVKPFTYLSDSRKEKWKAERDHPLVEPLFARTKAKPPIRSDANFDVNGEVLVSSKVVHDAAAVFAVDHVCIKTALSLRAESSHPTYGLSADGIDVSIVLNGEGNICPMLRKHDAAPSTHIKKREGIWGAMPNAIHRAGTNCSDSRLRVEGKPPLYLWMQFGKVGTKSPLVYRSHDCSLEANRRHRREEANIAEDIHPTMESAIIARFKVTGLKVAVRKAGEFRVTATVARTINAMFAR